MSFLVLTTRLKKSCDIGPVLLPSRAIALQGNCRVWIRTSNPFKKPEILLQAAHDAWLKFENFTEEQVERILLEISKVGIANAEPFGEACRRRDRLWHGRAQDAEESLLRRGYVSHDPSYENDP